MLQSQVDKIFNGADALKAAAATSGGGGHDSVEELTPEQFAAMKRDVELLGELKQFGLQVSCRRQSKKP